MRVVNLEQPASGTYLLISSTAYEGMYYLLIRRGDNIQIVAIPTDILHLPSPGGLWILEIKESGGYRVPIVRAANDAAEVEAIKTAKPSGGTPRRVIC